MSEWTPEEISSNERNKHAQNISLKTLYTRQGQTTAQDPYVACWDS